MSEADPVPLGALVDIIIVRLAAALESRSANDPVLVSDRRVVELVGDEAGDEEQSGAECYPHGSGLHSDGIADRLEHVSEHADIWVAALDGAEYRMPKPALAYAVRVFKDRIDNLFNEDANASFVGENSPNGVYFPDFGKNFAHHRSDLILIVMTNTHNLVANLGRLDPLAHVLVTFVALEIGFTVLPSYEAIFMFGMRMRGDEMGLGRVMIIPSRGKRLESRKQCIHISCHTAEQSLRQSRR